MTKIDATQGFKAEGYSVAIDTLTLAHEGVKPI